MQDFFRMRDLNEIEWYIMFCTNHEYSYVPNSIHFHLLTVMYDDMQFIGNMHRLPVIVYHVKKLNTAEQIYLYI